MEQSNKLPVGLEYIDSQLYLYRCPKCGRENYILNVSLGICTWCGYNANLDYPKTLNDNQNEQDNR